MLEPIGDSGDLDYFNNILKHYGDLIVENNLNRNAKMITNYIDKYSYVFTNNGINFNKPIINKILTFQEIVTTFNRLDSKFILIKDYILKLNKIIDICNIYGLTLLFNKHVKKSNKYELISGVVNKIYHINYINHNLLKDTFFKGIAIEEFYDYEIENKQLREYEYIMKIKSIKDYYHNINSSLNYYNKFKSFYIDYE